MSNYYREDWDQQQQQQQKIRKKLNFYTRQYGSNIVVMSKFCLKL